MPTEAAVMLSVGLTCQVLMVVHFWREGRQYAKTKD